MADEETPAKTDNPNELKLGGVAPAAGVLGAMVLLVVVLLAVFNHEDPYVGPPEPVVPTVGEPK